MSIIRKALLVATFAVVSSQVSADPKFTAWYGKNAIQEGDGGEMHVVEGIEVWTNGAPPRAFKLIGYISDTRLKTGLIGKMKMKGQEKAVALEAKKVEADAVIAVSSETETTGYVGNATAQNTRTGNTSNTFGSGFAAPVQKDHSRFAVIQYVQETKEQPAPVNSAVDGEQATPAEDQAASPVPSG